MDTIGTFEWYECQDETRVPCPCCGALGFSEGPYVVTEHARRCNFPRWSVFSATLEPQWN